MRSIAIILGDNDFGNTFENLLKGLKLVLECRYHRDAAYGGRELDQKHVAFIIRRSILTYYISYQYTFNPTNYSAPSMAIHLDSILHHLEKATVLFDEEAEQSALVEDHDGGAWILNIQSGQVSRF